MYDKELIQKICNLTCSKSDVDRNQTTIKYDTEHPFKKYYDTNTIIGAIKKYTTKEWDDQTLAGWACIYCWILSGGFDDNLTENLNSFEDFFKHFITYDLDGLSFFSAEEEHPQFMDEEIRLFESFDHIWQTRNKWKAIYSMVGTYAKDNGAQYVALINDTTKEYMIMYSDHLENGFEDEYFKFVPEDKYIAIIEQLKDAGYKILSCSERYYYEEVTL